MASLAADAVSLYPTALGAAEWFPDKANRTILTRRLQLVLTGQGDAIDQIGAAALGFDKILTTSNAFLDDGDVTYIAAVNPLLNIILLEAPDGTSATTVSGTVTITVTGTPKVLAA